MTGTRVTPGQRDNLRGFARVLILVFPLIAIELTGPLAQPGWAQIFNDYNGAVIQGTQGITPGPGIDLSNWNTPGHILEDANLGGFNLANATFAESDLTGSSFSDSTLTNADFTNTNLSNSNMEAQDLSSANFSGAVVAGANFANLSDSGFSASQLYSTASYANGNLAGIELEDNFLQNNLIGWNFAGQNLTGAALSGNLTGTIFKNANLTNTNLSNAEITNADLTGATVQGTNLSNVFGNGITSSQLYSTASYSEKNLNGIDLLSVDLTGWDLSNQNLSGATLLPTPSTNVTGAIINNAGLRSSSGQGIDASQLYSTASYANGNLTGVNLGGDLTGWSFAGQNLQYAKFQSANVTNVDFSNANLTDVLLEGATVTNANFAGAIINGADLSITTGLVASQLYSTSSYIEGNLTGINFLFDDLSGGNFVNQNLSNDNLTEVRFVNCNFTDANLSDCGGSAYFAGANLSDADFRGSGQNFNDASGNPILHDTIMANGSVQGLAMQAGETFIVRNNSIAIAVNTSASFDPQSTLNFLLTGGWSSPIEFSADLTPSLGGTLDLDFADSVDPSTLVGDTFQLFDWSGPLPGNDRFSDITTDSGYAFDLSNLYTTGSVTLTAIPEPAANVILCGVSCLLLRRRLRYRFPTLDFEVTRRRLSGV